MTRSRIASFLPLVVGMVSGLWPSAARADFTKTITVSPGVQVNAVTTWYYANCTTILGVGSFTVDVAPKHGTVTFGAVSGPLPGCPSGSPSLPAVAAFYTWTDETTPETTDYFQLTYSVNGLSQLEDITVNLAAPPSTEPCDQILTSRTVVSVPGQLDSRTTIGVGEVVQLNSTYPATWTITGKAFLSQPTNGGCSPSTSSVSVTGSEACFSAPFIQGRDTVTAVLANGQSCSIQLNTIEPTGVIYQRLTAVQYGYNDPSFMKGNNIDMWAAFFVLPGTVSFANIGVAEEDVDAPHVTSVTNRLYTIPAAKGFGATNAWLVGCDKNTLPAASTYLPAFNIAYTWGAADYQSANKKDFATAETRLPFTLLVYTFKKGEIPFNGSRFSNFIEPFAELDVSLFSRSSVFPDISGACYEYVDKQFTMVPMSR